MDNSGSFVMEFCKNVKVVSWRGLEDSKNLEKANNLKAKKKQ